MENHQRSQHPETCFIPILQIQIAQVAAEPVQRAALDGMGARTEHHIGTEQPVLCDNIQILQIQIAQVAAALRKEQRLMGKS